jgi:hypothetical protein
MEKASLLKKLGSRRKALEEYLFQIKHAGQKSGRVTDKPSGKKFLFKKTCR